MKFRVGDWVEVRSKEEILRSLDKKGQLEGMPFMPQMFHYCGQKFALYKRAHKTCDTVNPIRGATCLQCYSSGTSVRRGGVWRVPGRVSDLSERRLAQTGWKNRAIARKHPEG